MNQANRPELMRSLFDQALEMEDMERRWFLQSIDDRDLAADVERLLESSACCGRFSEKDSTPNQPPRDGKTSGGSCSAEQ